MLSLWFLAVALFPIFQLPLLLLPLLQTNKVHRKREQRESLDFFRVEYLVWVNELEKEVEKEG